MSVENNDLYSMSDDDFLDANPSKLFEAGTPEEESLSSVSEEEVTDVESEEETFEPENLDESTEVDEDTDQEVSEPNLDDDSEEGEDDETETDESEEEDTPEQDETSEPNLQEELDELLAPLPHHGSNFEIKSKEEARRLMSMGLDYARKTRGLKEQRKYLKMLDNNELLSEDKLSFLIDVSKGSKEAIAKLIRDHKLDTMDLDHEEDNKYTPSSHTVSDSEVELDEVLDSLRDTPSFSDTMSIVSNWDESSKSVLAKQPQILSVINEHKASGIYDMVKAEMDRERVLGGLKGLSELEAYREIGDRLYAQGKFNLDNKPNTEQAKPTKKVVVKPKAEKPELQEQRRKASSNKPSKPRKTKQEYDFWNMSDDDFEQFNL